MFSSTNGVHSPTLSAYELIPVFSFLGCKDLGRVGRVCKDWYAAHKTDSLWQRFCDPCPQGELPIYGSWKERYTTVLRNWYENRLGMPMRAGGGFEGVFQTLSRLPDGRVVFVVKETDYYFKRPAKFVVKDAVTGECISTTREFENFSVRGVLAQGLDLLVWDKQGEIFCFDIQTGKEAHPPLAGLPPADGCKRELLSTDKNIIVVVGGRAFIANKRSGEIKTLEVPEYWDKVCTTPNFLFFLLSEDKSIVAIDISDPLHTIRQIVEPNSHDAWRTICASGCYVAVSEGEVVKLFVVKGRDKTIHLLHVHKCPPSPGSSLVPAAPSFMHISNHWLSVNRGGLLYVWELETGEKISTLPIESAQEVFNYSEILVTRTLDCADPGTDVCYYSFYDFRKNMEPTP